MRGTKLYKCSKCSRVAFKGRLTVGSRIEFMCLYHPAHEKTCKHINVFGEKNEKNFKKCIDYRCPICDKLLFKGHLERGSLTGIKCYKCGNMTMMEWL